MAATKNKETVYIDVDDEITSIIEKVKGSDSKIVALVLPKRATVLQSVVNMKLLKKAAATGKKSIVLITSEKGLMPLAGVAGLHVAKSLQSKPAIPPLPTQPGEEDEETEVVDEENPQLDKAAPIGVLSAAAAHDDDDTETIELDNMAMEDAPVAAGAVAATKAKKLKHLKVPNFERFRLSFVLAIAGFILLIIAWFVAGRVLPKANVIITTNTTTAVSSFDFVASTKQTELDVENKKVPATQKESKKKDTEKVKATGQKDMGTKAEGTVQLSVSCASGDTVSVPAGTTLSTGGQNFVTQTTVTLNNHLTTPCRFAKNVAVAAAQNGDAYNIASGKTFSVTGYSSVSGSNSAAFTGGTSKIVKVVSQKDIDDAAATIKTKQEKQVGDELKAQFDAEQLYTLAETLQIGETKVTASPAIDKEAEETTVTVDATYTMLGIKRDDLSQLIKDDVADDPSLQGQAVSDDGIDDGIMRINNQPSPGEAFISFRTTVVAGPEIDTEAIKTAIAGKKRGEAETYIKQQPGVDEATIDYSPFWVYSTPKSKDKITVTIVKAGDQPANESTGDDQ